MTSQTIPRYSNSHPDVPHTDPRDGLLTEKQRENYRKLARTIYAHMAKMIASPKTCSDVCRRRGSCAYFQPKELMPEEPDYLAHNLRNRDMPLCLAVMMDEEGDAEFQALVTIALW